MGSDPGVTGFGRYYQPIAKRHLKLATRDSAALNGTTEPEAGVQTSMVTAATYHRGH